MVCKVENAQNKSVLFVSNSLLRASIDMKHVYMNIRFNNSMKFDTLTCMTEFEGK